MYFLFDTCQHPDILRVLYFIYLLLDIVFVVVPIGLVIMLMVDFTKAVIVGDEKEQIKNTKLVVKRIIYAVLIFVIPWVVNVLMIFIDEVGLDIGGDYRACITNVKDIRNDTKTFEYFESLLEISEEVEPQKNQNSGNNSNNGNSSNSGNGSGSSGGNVSSDSVYEEAATAMVNLAKAEIGHVGGGKYSGLDDSVPWCAYFVKYILKNTTIAGKGTALNYITNGEIIGECDGACAGDLTSMFANHQELSFEKSSYYGGNYTPKKGDIIFFWSPGTHDGRYWDKTVSDASHAGHIGFVDYVKDGHVYTIEGNVAAGQSGSADNVVGSKQLNLASDYIMAYGVWYE